MLQRQAVERLCVERPKLGTAVQNRGQPVRVGQVDVLPLHKVPIAVGIPGGVEAALQQQRQGGRLDGLKRCGILGWGGRGAAVQAPAVHQLVHFQRGQQLRGGSGVTGLAQVGGRVGLDGRVLADRAQHIGQVGLVAVGGQLGALPRLDGLVVDVVIDALQTAELRNQRQRGFFADAGHAGDVVRRIAHQALDVDELRRLDAVLLADGGGVHEDGLFVGRQQNRRCIVHKLQAVAVTGSQQRRAARGLARCGQRAENIVGLPARLADLHKAKVGQQLLQNRHLLGQLLGHAVAGGLVAVVGGVAERRRALIPRDGDGVGLVRRQQVEQYILEAVDGVGVAAILRRQQLDAEKRAVDQAVAVQDHEFHAQYSL